MAHGSHEAREVPFVRYDKMPAGMRAAALGMIAVGVILWIVALLTNADRAWHAYLANWLFFTSIAAGAFMLSVIVTITKGVWSRPIRRIALSFVAFLPIAFVLMVPMFFAADHIFPWLHEPVAGKEAYLNMPFLIVRNVVLFGLFVWMATIFARTALRPDVGAVRSKMSGNVAALYERLSGGWRGQAAEELQGHRRLARLAPALALVYAAAFSVIAWDFVMSLEPHWFSTLLGPYLFMGAILGGFSATSLLTRAYSRGLHFEDRIAPQQWHDLGKLMFGFVVFWAYLFFSQFIVIWYGMLPMEQSFVIHRFTAPFSLISKIVFACLFVIPFFGMLGVTPKRTPRTQNIFAGIILVGLWLERWLLVYPSHNIGAESLPLGWQEIGTAPLFAGLLLLSLGWFASRFPLLQIWEPQSEIELRGVPIEVGETVAAR
jgi:Ni/Fe-hydrogenase subunit HybB-like protein